MGQAVSAETGPPCVAPSFPDTVIPGVKGAGAGTTRKKEESKAVATAEAGGSPKAYLVLLMSEPSAWGTDSLLNSHKSAT